ncbi:MAG TPA: DoxX family protein [Burkholderiales bacterium]|nr:DoxX family protein [Burkholderiales bacterium]
MNWRAMIWTGRALSALVILFLLVDAGMKLAGLPQVDAAMSALGFRAGLGPGLGALTLAIALLYAWPRTALLGAILMTGLLGGSMAAHLRVESPVLTHLLFGLYVGALAWTGLWLRDSRLRSLLSWRAD